MSDAKKSSDRTRTPPPDAERKTREAPRLDEDTPRFAREFPADPRLAVITRAFARGDFKAVNEDADALLASSKDEAVKAAARILKERTRAHPLAKYMFLLATILLLVLSSYWVTESKRPHVELRTATAPSAAPQILTTSPASSASAGSGGASSASTSPASSNAPSSAPTQK